MPESILEVPRERVNKKFVSVAAAVFAFLAYTCVYAYRKPFTVATYDEKYCGIAYQTLLIISQVFGYLLSKFAGIKFISELRHANRQRAGIMLVLLSWLCLLLFAVSNSFVGLLLLFINGFTLGFLWGIIFSYLEGRTSTDFIGAVMAVSFIFAGGFTRSVAKWLMLQWHVPGRWMPFATGLLFIGPFLLFFLLLDRLPAPDGDDISSRTERKPMTRQDRKDMLRFLGSGVIVVIIAYLLLTIMRDVRDNYMANLWQELGYGDNYSIFTSTETFTSLVILCVMAMLVLVRRNMLALQLVHGIIILGFVIAATASVLFVSDKLTGAAWMQCVSIGLYMGYIPFNCIFFERLIAAFRLTGTIGFLMYIADSFGYLGSVVVMLGKELFTKNISWSQFYCGGVIWLCIIGGAGTLFSLIYFNRKFSWFTSRQSL